VNCVSAVFRCYARRVVFRKVVSGVSGVRIPKALIDKKLPDMIVYKLEKMLNQFVKEYGL